MATEEVHVDTDLPTGEAAPEVLEGRIWVDGCWDFFHHGLFFSTKPIC